MVRVEIIQINKEEDLIIRKPLELYSQINKTIRKKEFVRTNEEVTRQRSKYKGRTQYLQKQQYLEIYLQLE